MPAAADKVVAGFPELTGYQRLCPVCALAATAPGLLRLIHDAKVADPDKSLRALAREFEPALTDHGQRFINHRSYAKHFGKHVTLAKRASLDKAVPGLPEVSGDTLASDERALLDETADNGATGADGSDYKHMWDLFSRMFRRVKAIDGDPVAFLNADGTAPNAYKLALWQKLVAECRMILAELHKMRNADRLVMRMLEEQTQSFAVAVVEPVSSTLSDMIASFRTAAHRVGRGKPRSEWDRETYEAYVQEIEDLTAALDNFLRRRVPGIFMRAAEGSLTQSRERYRLH